MPKNKSFLPPPLVFSGNKRFWAGELADEALLLPAGARVWDVFGGSGVCSRVIKDARPDCEVVWNDYDGYSDRLLHAAETEDLRRSLIRMCGYEGCQNDGTRFRAPITGALRDDVLALFRAHYEKYGYFDGLTVRRWLSIGACKAPFDPYKPPADLYARVPRAPLRVGQALAWCEGLVVVHKDFLELDIRSGDFVILDPPYVGSCVDEYSGRETLQILRGCRDLMEICPFILFGDASISFWYEVLTEKYNPRFFQKDGLISGYNGKSRSEVMFSTW